MNHILSQLIKGHVPTQHHLNYQERLDDSLPRMIKSLWPNAEILRIGSIEYNCFSMYNPADYTITLEQEGKLERYYLEELACYFKRTSQNGIQLECGLGLSLKRMAATFLN